MVVDMQISEGFRLSPQQRRLWSLLREGDGVPYRVQYAVRLTGDLDVEACRGALERAAARHEILSTNFRRLPSMDLPLQVLGAGGVEWEQGEDWSAFDLSRQELLLADLFDRTCRLPFDLVEGPVLRARFVALSPREHLLLLSLPALTADAESVRHLVRETGLFYAARLDGGEPADEPIQYPDLAEWQNSLLEVEDKMSGREFWRGKNLSPGLKLRLPFGVRPTERPPFAPELVSAVLPSATTEGLETLAERLEVQLSRLLESLWAVFLWRLTGDGEVVLASAYGGRKYQELDGALGPLARCLPVQCRMDGGQRIAEVVRTVGEAAGEVQRWQEFFDWSWLETSNGGSAPTPFFPFCFDFEQRSTERFSEGLSWSLARRFACIDRFEIKLSCILQDGRLTTELHYDSSLFSARDIDRSIQNLHRLLASSAADPEAPVGRLDMLGESERRMLLIELSRTRSEPRRQPTVHAAFEEQTAVDPDAAAVVCEDQCLSYGELNARANQLAHLLRVRGVGPGVFVPLLMERSVEVLVAILGVLKSGAAYVPLDPLSPRARLLSMLGDLEAPLLITTAGLEARLADHGLPVLRLDAERHALEQQNRDNLGGGATPEDAVYALFTSGSTGRPKAVVVEHRQLSNYVQSILRELDFERGMSFAIVSTFAADLGHTAVYPTLCSGGCLHIVSQQRASEADALAELFRRHPIDCLKIVPSHLEALLASRKSADLLPRRRLVLGGEAASWDLIGKIRGTGSECTVVNHYGPTEATVGAVTYRLPRGVPAARSAQVPLGRPIANAEVYLLDPWEDPVPRGLPGELNLGGAGLARGYLGRPELTAERFVPHPFSDCPGERLYRTGDLARYLEDGNLEFLGRVDHQIKIRGFRIELREIEVVLEEHPGVEKAVAVWKASGERPRLVVYLVPDRQRALGVLQRLRLPTRDLPQDLSFRELPNGMLVCEMNGRETEFLFHEIFEDQVYLRHGITLDENACVFDVGANIGLFSLSVAHRCPNAVIYAFEPIPPVFEVLRCNTSLHGLNAKLFNCGLADQGGSQTFTHYPHLSLMSSRYSDPEQEREVVRSFLRSAGGNGAGGAGDLDDALLETLLADRLEAESFLCPMRTISEVIREQGIERIDLLKIDVQKSELDVLRGIEEQDWSKIRQIVVEVHELDGRVAVIRALLARAGYEVEIEQENALASTCLHQIYAMRPAAGLPAPTERMSAPVAQALTRWASAERLIEDVRAFLGERLPEFMIPGSFVLLDSIPLTPNGKVDRQGLTARDDEERPAVEDLAAPRTPVEEMLAGIWSELLGLRKVGTHQSFFEIGGHSLLATRLISRIRETFGVEIPLRRLFDKPTVSALAESIEAGLRNGRQASAPPLERVARDRPLPLSFAQQRLWFLQEMEPRIPAYNIPLALRLVGPLDGPALQAAFSEIVRRHEVLRTTFDLVDGQPAQRIAPPSPLPVACVDLGALPEADREPEARSQARSEARRAFDLRRGPLVRTLLLRLGEEEQVLLVTLHHIVTDGWSNVILAREFAALYGAFSNRVPPALQELPLQYADFACWQRHWMQGEVLEQQLSYWRQKLGGSLPRLELPTDRPRPEAKSWRGATEPLQLSATLSAALRELSRREGATLFMVLLAAFKTLLYRYTGQEDIIVGCGVANRGYAELEGLIGFFVNTLALRTDASGNPSFRELLQRIRETALGAYAHQDLPFERIVEELQPGRRGEHAPLFRVMFSLQDVPAEPLDLPHLRAHPFASRSDTAKFDLILTLRDAQNGLAGSMEHDTDLFEGASIVRTLAHFTLILEEIVRNPEVRLLDISLEGESLEPSASADEMDQFHFGR